MTRWILCGLFTLMAACGDDGASGPSAQDKCDMLLDVVCDRLITCAEQLSGQTAPSGIRQACIDKQRTAYDCSRAKAVTASYDRCISEVSSFTCGIFLTTDTSGNVQVNVPASCNAVITVN